MFDRAILGDDDYYGVERPPSATRQISEVVISTIEHIVMRQFTQLASKPIFLFRCGKLSYAQRIRKQPVAQKAYCSTRWLGCCGT